MVVAVRMGSPTKGKPPKLNMLELVSMVNNRYKKTKLRRKVLPKAYCYVCSKVDPSGIFKQPNSYLYQKGFFHACEHFPKAPNSTFVEDEEPRDEPATKLGTESSKGCAPSFSVTIQHGSSISRSRFGSELRREKTFDTATEKHVSRQTLAVSRSVDERSGGGHADSGRQRSDVKTEQESEKHHNLSLPTSSFGRAEKTRSSKRSERESLKRFSGKHSRFSKPETHVTSVSEHFSELYKPGSRVTVIPTGFNDEGSSASISASQTPRSLPKQADSPSVANSNKSQRRQSKVDEVIQTKPFINDSDGLGVVGSQDHLVREVILLDVLPPQSSRSRTTKTSKERGKHMDTATDNSSEYRPESGHLRYHHRGDEDSVPHPGFEMPPTPSAQEVIEMERQEAERRELERQIKLGNVFDNSSSKGHAESVASDDISLVLPVDRVKSRVSGSFTSGKHSFCRCSSYLRELSVTNTTCNTCGRIIRQGSEICSRESSHRRGRMDFDTASRSSLGSLASRTRQKMLLDGHRAKIQTVTDEDYMDLESIIHEDDAAHYYSDDDSDTLSKGGSSELRYRNAKPFPLVNPDIHKLVYIKALQSAQYEKKPLVVDATRLRRPHVFSYFQLWPFAAKSSSTAEHIGLQPDDSILPKKGQVMKHIFGNVKLDDYYPMVQGQFKAKKTVINDSGPRSVSIKASPKLPEIPSGERSSVGLKMMKQMS